MYITKTFFFLLRNIIWPLFMSESETTHMHVGFLVLWIVVKVGIPCLTRESVARGDWLIQLQVVQGFNHLAAKKGVSEPSKYAFKAVPGVQMSMAPNRINFLSHINFLSDWSSSHYHQQCIRAPFCVNHCRHLLKFY